MALSSPETHSAPDGAPPAEDSSIQLNPPNAFTAFLIAAAVGYVGMLIFVFTFGLHGDELTAGIDRACAEVAYHNGRRVQGQGNYELALKLYRQALDGRFSEKSREYECGRAIGSMLLGLGRLEEAIDAYRSLPPDAFTLPVHFMSYVAALFRAGKYEDAQRVCAEWLAQAQAAGDQEQILWANVNMGRIMDRLDRLDDAYSYLQRAADAAPDGNAPIFMADILRKQGRTAAAIELLDKYLARVTSGPMHEEAARLRAKFIGAAP